MTKRSESRPAKSYQADSKPAASKQTKSNQAKSKPMPMKSEQAESKPVNAKQTKSQQGTQKPTISNQSKSQEERPADRSVRAKWVLSTLRKRFPQPKTALLHESPFQLLVSTILSAQCTDGRVNMVTPILFARYGTPRDFARANQADLEEIIRSTGFFRMKARNIIACSAALVERFGGEVPSRIEDLVTLPGVGRKTANVVLGQAFGIASGVVVDTHVHRLSQRLGFTGQNTPEKIELDLMELFPKKDWIDLASILILHGRATCNARRPRCAECAVRAECPSAESSLPA
jgi:endonuclease-3